MGASLTSKELNEFMKEADKVIHQHFKTVEEPATEKVVLGEHLWAGQLKYKDKSKYRGKDKNYGNFLLLSNWTMLKFKQDFEACWRKCKKVVLEILFRHSQSQFWYPIKGYN